MTWRDRNITDLVSLSDDDVRSLQLNGIFRCGALWDAANNGEFFDLGLRHNHYVFNELQLLRDEQARMVDTVPDYRQLCLACHEPVEETAMRKPSSWCVNCAHDLVPILLNACQQTLAGYVSLNLAEIVVLEDAIKQTGVKP